MIKIESFSTKTMTHKSYFDVWGISQINDSSFDLVAIVTILDEEHVYHIDLVFL